MATLSSEPAYASELGFDDLVHESDTRLVVVEFFATWCEPCIKALPRWENLRKKYREQGLRFVLVRTKDPQGSCLAPSGILPDKFICDPDGSLADKLGVDELPSAFLWDWQGRLRAPAGHLSEIRDAIDQALASLPRLEFEIAASSAIKNQNTLAAVKNEIKRWGKFAVVATAQEQARLAAIRKRSFALTKSRKTRCKLGQEMAANTLLSIEESKKHLMIQLINAETACVTASTRVMKAAKYSPDKAIKQAVAELHQKLQRKKFQLPRGEFVELSKAKLAKGATRLDDVDGSQIVNQMTDEKGFLSVDTQPQGAEVRLNGAILGKTPIQIETMVGDYVLTATMGKRYHPLREEFKLATTGLSIKSSLKPAFGKLEINSKPKGAAVWLDGEKVGSTPLVVPEKLSGVYEYRIEKPYHLPATGELRVNDNKLTTENIRLGVFSGSLRIRSTPSGAAIYLDGVKLPKESPHTLEQIQPGIHVLELEKTGFGRLRQTFEVKNRDQKNIEFNLTPIMGMLKLVAEDDTGSPCKGVVKIGSRSLGMTPLKTKLQVGQYELSVTCGEQDAITTVSIEHNRETNKRIQVSPSTGKLIPIKGGSFHMGCKAGSRYCSETSSPPIQVHVENYQIDKHEVTVGAYRRCVDAGYCTEPLSGGLYTWTRGNDKLPVTGVSYSQSVDFCSWTEKRLPTEAEWEYAARNGSSSIYPWGKKRISCKRVTSRKVGRKSCGVTGPSEVCLKKSGKSQRGICDLLGNVAEWVQDNFSSYHAGRDGSGAYQDDSNRFTIRGGGWGSDASQLSSLSRNGSRKSEQNFVTGFRCAR